MRLPALAATVFLLAGLPLAAGACGAKKVTECNNLITVINKGVSDLDKGTKTEPKAEGDASGIAEMKALAGSMDKIAEEASKVELSLPELKKFSADYQAMAREVATHAREMAAAAEAKDADKVKKAQEAMEKAAKQEDPIVDGINKFCQAP